MSQESQVPFGTNPNSPKPIFSELDELYLRQLNSPTNDQSQTERPVSPHIAELNGIANRLTAARSHRLDNPLPTPAERQRVFVGAVIKVVFGDSSSRRSEPLTDVVLRTRESEIGATIFGDFGPNERREFFYDGSNGDRHSWFFYQEITDPSGSVHTVTLHYEVHPTGVLRLSSSPYTKNEFISGQELDNFLTATRIYHDLVMSRLYPDTVHADNVHRLRDDPTNDRLAA